MMTSSAWLAGAYMAYTHESRQCVCPNRSQNIHFSNMSRSLQSSPFFNAGAFALIKLALAALRYSAHENVDYCMLHALIDLLMLVLAGVHIWSCFYQTSKSSAHVFIKGVVQLLTVPGITQTLSLH